MTERTSTVDPALSGLLTIEQIAAMAGCSVRAIQTYRARREFPEPLRLGPRMVRWTRSAIEEWLAR